MENFNISISPIQMNKTQFENVQRLQDEKRFEAYHNNNYNYDIDQAYEPVPYPDDNLENRLNSIYNLYHIN